ncbi:MAG: methyltransferase domain-containing protein [archaeon]|jgi:SAM-dependent methyltransferase
MASQRVERYRAIKAARRNSQNKYGSREARQRTVLKRYLSEIKSKNPAFAKFFLTRLKEQRATLGEKSALEKQFLRLTALADLKSSRKGMKFIKTNFKTSIIPGSVSSNEIDGIKRKLKAHLNSKKRFRAVYLKRKYLAGQLHSGRNSDRSGSWGVSFRANLSKVSSAFGFDLANDLLEKSRGRKLKVLEIGGGIGLTAHELKKAVPNMALTVTGLTWLPEWKSYDNSNKINWKVAHSNNLRRVAKPNSLDYIYSNLALCHSADLAGALRESGRLLKIGGKLVFSAEDESQINFIPQDIFEIQKVNQLNMPNPDSALFNMVRLVTFVLIKKSKLSA